MPIAPRTSQYLCQAGSTFGPFPRSPTSCTPAYLHAHANRRVPSMSNLTTILSQQQLRGQFPAHEARLVLAILSAPVKARCQKPTLAMRDLVTTRTPLPRYTDWLAQVYLAVEAAYALQRNTPILVGSGRPSAAVNLTTINLREVSRSYPVIPPVPLISTVLTRTKPNLMILLRVQPDPTIPMNNRPSFSRRLAGATRTPPKPPDSPRSRPRPLVSSNGNPTSHAELGPLPGSAQTSRRRLHAGAQGVYGHAAAHMRAWSVAEMRARLPRQRRHGLVRASPACCGVRPLQALPSWSAAHGLQAVQPTRHLRARAPGTCTLASDQAAQLWPRQKDGEGCSSATAGRRVDGPAAVRHGQGGQCAYAE